MTRRTAHVLVALALSFSLAACGGEDEELATDAGTEVTEEEVVEEEVEEPAATDCETVPPTAEPPAEISTDLSVKPEIPAAEGPPPCGLVISDIVEGTGAEAVPGSTVQVKYVGAFYETGEEFDSSFSRGADETLPVTLGAGQVIPGFEQALTGLKVGGRRLVTIPSDLAYGPQGQGPIPGGATLRFVLDLVEVTPPQG